MTDLRVIARHVAAGFYVRGYEQQDLEQEAAIAIWEAARTFDPDRGTAFTTYAYAAARNRLGDLVRQSFKSNRRMLNEAVSLEYELAGGDATLAAVIAREELRAAIDAVRDLSPLERRTLLASVRGAYSSRDKQADNALTRARMKVRTRLQPLREAA